MKLQSERPADADRKVLRMNEQDRDRVHIRICPYCFREISNEDAAFLLKTDGYHFNSPALNESLLPGKDEEYRSFWNAMGIPDERVDDMRSVIDNEGIAVLNQELSISGAELAVKKYDRQSRGYTFFVEEGALTVYSNTMLCPYCHNVLPQNFFKYETMMIGLAGSVASGKTVYLSSLIMNGFDVMQRDNLTVRNADGNPNDLSKIEMEKNADQLARQGICPESTSKIFRKPMFLEVHYQLPDRSVAMLTAIYDVAGELIREGVGSGRTGFMRHMDGYICLVDPEQMHLSRAFFSRRTPGEEQVLSKLHLMSLSEQIAIQQRSLQNGHQIFDPKDFMMEDEVEDTYIYERKVDVILDAIRAGVGDQELRRKYMALTIAKRDLLENLSEIRNYRGSSLIFDRGELHYGFLDMNRHLLRQEALRPIFDQKIFHLQRFLDDYRAGSLFAVSALGCETEEIHTEDRTDIRAIGEVHPSGVEEPVLWMIMKYMQERGWIE